MTTPLALTRRIFFAAAVVATLMGSAQSARADYRVTTTLGAVTAPAFFNVNSLNLPPGFVPPSVPVPSTVSYNYIEFNTNTTAATTASGSITIPFTMLFEAINPPSTVVAPSQTRTGTAVLAYNITNGFGTLNLTSLTIGGTAITIGAGGTVLGPIDIGSGAFQTRLTLSNFNFAAPTITPGPTPNGNLSVQINAVPVPEPASVGLMGLGMVASVLVALRRRKAA